MTVQKIANITKRVCAFALACALMLQARPARLDVKAETGNNAYRENNQRNIEYINSLQTGTSAYYAELSEIDGIEPEYVDGAFAAFGKDSEAVYNVAVGEAGYYNLAVSFYPDEKLLSNIDVGIAINGEIPFEAAGNVRMYTEWTDAGEILTDRYGNEAVPMQTIISKNYTVELSDHNGDTPYAYVFYFDAGDNEIRITNNRTDFYIEDMITLVPIERIIGYDEYRQSYAGAAEVSGLSVYEAEIMLSKNKASILPEAERDPSMTPYDSNYLKLNYVGGDNFYSAGERVNWEIEAPETGLYQITLKVKQFYSELVDAPVFRTFYVDGKIPFAELSCYKIDYGNRWRYETLSDDSGRPFLIYLEKGTHTLSMSIDNSPFSGVITSMKQMIDEINDFSLDIRKMTGNVVDRNRDWDLSEYLPHAGETVDGWVRSLQEMHDYLQELAGSRAKYVTFMRTALQMMTIIARDPNDLPNQLSALATGGSSVFAQLSNIITYVEAQPMPIDTFYVHGADAELPPPEVSFFVKLSESVRRFFRTFGAQEYAPRQSDDEVTVWVGKGRQYVTLLQQMVDTDFTQKTGIKVNLSIMPDEKKMVLGNATGTNPDMVIGASTNYPYELAIRGAAADLSKMDGFFEAAQNMQPGAFISYMMDGGVYGLPETQDFWVMYYRKDIMAKLGLNIPETWDEVLEILPTLQRYGMNFASNISFFGATKPLQATVPYIYQFGGALVSDDGLTTAIDRENAIRGIKFMTDLFNIYSTPERIEKLNVSMQRGEIPIGLGNFGTYLTLSFAADDMTGKWDIAPIPGVMQSDGTINRQAPGAAQCSIIFENSDKKEQAWELLKWYMSTEIQTMYSERLYMTYGEGYLLNTANINAFRDAQIIDEHKEVILTQWESLVELPRIPGYYMIERELSNVWNKVVIDGASVRETVDDSAVLINREIWRKMEEFKYVVDGRLERPYDVPTLPKVTEWLNDGLRKERGE